MKPNLRTQYWDSTVIVSFFNARHEVERARIVRILLEEAEAGRLEIITSTFALVEVLKVDRDHPLSKEAEDKISGFFEKPYIHLVTADRLVCQQARMLVWKFPSLKSKDAVHLASALVFAEKRYIHEVFSWDSDFIKLDGKITKKFPVRAPFVESPSLEDWARNKPAEPEPAAE